MNIVFSHERTGQFDCVLKHDSGVANGKAASGFSEEADHTLLIGTRSADSDEFEADLSAALDAVFTTAQTNFWTNVAIDVDSFAERTLIPYVNNAIIDWLFERHDFGSDDRLTVFLLQGAWAPKEELLLKAEEALLKPVKETVNQFYGDADDPITKKVDKLLEGRQKHSFQDCLLRLIDSRHYAKDSEAYKRSGVSKSTFAKIMNCRMAYKPARTTVAAFAIGLKLNLEEAQELYRSAGFYLGETDKFDIVIRCFIQERRCDIFDVNCCLFELGLPLLGERTRDSSIAKS